MHIDPDDTASCSKTLLEVHKQLRRLRDILVRGSQAHERLTGIRRDNPAIMLVRLHSDENGGLWYNTGDPKYDTQLGVAQVDIQLSALADDTAVAVLADHLVSGIAAKLRDRAAQQAVN